MTSIEGTDSSNGTGKPTPKQTWKEGVEHGKVIGEAKFESWRRSNRGPFDYQSDATDETQVIPQDQIARVQDSSHLSNTTPEPASAAQVFASVGTGLILYPLVLIVFLAIVFGGFKFLQWIVGL